MKKVLLFITFLLIMSVIVFLYYSKRPSIEKPTFKIELPDPFLKDLDLVNLNGDSISLLSYLGKPIVLNFWATWCLPCVSEMGSFETVRQEKKDSVHFILISDEPVEKIKKFTDKKGYQLIYLKSEVPLEELGIRKIPQSYFYTKNGVIKNKFNESIYSKIIREELSKLKE